MEVSGVRCGVSGWRVAVSCELNTALPAIKTKGWLDHVSEKFPKGLMRIADLHGGAGSYDGIFSG